MVHLTGLETAIFVVCLAASAYGFGKVWHIVRVSKKIPSLTFIRSAGGSKRLSGRYCSRAKWFSSARCPASNFYGIYDAGQILGSDSLQVNGLQATVQEFAPRRPHGAPHPLPAPRPLSSARPTASWRYLKWVAYATCCTDWAL